MPREMSNRGRVSVIAGINKGTLPPTGALSSLKPQSDPHLDLSAQPRAVSMLQLLTETHQPRHHCPGITFAIDS